MGLREAAFGWYARRWIGRVREGKEGAETMKAFAQLQGMRSAIIALVLLIEFLGQKLGFGGGFLAYAHTVLVAFGWDPKEALFDPTVVGTALLTLWATWGRFKAWRADLQKKTADAVQNPSRFPAPLLLLLALPMLSGCGSLAQVRLGGEARIHPDARVVQSYICAGDDDPARLYLGRPEYAWLGGALERYITDARDERTLGKCPCAKDGCQK